MNVNGEKGLLPFQREARVRTLRLAQPVAMGTASLVTGLTCAAARQVAAGQWSLPDQFSSAPAAADAVTPLRWASGVMAVANAGLGVYKILAEPDGLESDRSRTCRYVSGGGNLVVAAGLVGQVLGWGPWTLAISGAGVLATVIADAVRTLENPER
ncbi:MAG: hypothetical protein AB1758_04980 [Candidatus Eremiobacterota bacterium]